MKVTAERIPGSIVQLDIAADSDEFATAVERTYRKVSREVNIPGFRRGKAPRNLVERMVGREYIVDEAGRGMMDDLYRQALDGESLTPVGEPTDVDIYSSEPLAFKLKVEVFPEIELGDYQSVRVEPREVTLEDGEVEETIESIRRNYAEWVDLAEPRAPVEGDQVTVDIKVFEDGQQFQEPANDAVFVLGESNLFEALATAIQDLTPGETTEVTLAFEEDDTSVRPELRGKTLHYELALKDVKERKLPELDLDLAAKVGEFASLEEFREEIRVDLLRGKATEARNEAVREIIDAMGASSTLDIPAAMIDTEIDDELNQTRTRLAQQGLRFEDFLASSGKTEEALREELRPNAETRVRNTLVLQEIAKAEGLETTAADVDQEIERMSAGAADPERMRQLYGSDYFRRMLQNELHDRRLTARLIEIATEGRGVLTGEAAELLDRPATLTEDDPQESEDSLAESAGGDDDDSVSEVSLVETATGEVEVDEYSVNEDEPETAAVVSETDEDDTGAGADR